MNCIYEGANWLKSFFRRDVESGKRKPLSQFAMAAADLLGDWQRGIYHIRESALARARWDEWCVEIVLGISASTFDCDSLTRLVLLAHDRCIRVEISGCCARYLRLLLTPRDGVVGEISHRHPTIEQAISRHREEFQPLHWKTLVEQTAQRRAGARATA